jgi:hypothetical protein
MTEPALPEWWDEAVEAACVPLSERSVNPVRRDFWKMQVRDVLKMALPVITAAHEAELAQVRAQRNKMLDTAQRLSDERDTALAAIARHQKKSIECISEDCSELDCEHPNGCPITAVLVCEGCFDAITDNGSGIDTIPDDVLWPCNTSAALAGVRAQVARIEALFAGRAPTGNVTLAELRAAIDGAEPEKRIGRNEAANGGAA